MESSGLLVLTGYEEYASCLIATARTPDVPTMVVTKDDAPAFGTWSSRRADWPVIDTSDSAEVMLPTDDDWISRLSAPGRAYEEAVGELHELLLRAAGRQVNRMREAAMLGAVRRDEVIHSAADEATVAVLSRLSSFEGRSAFTTWAYKFGILQAGTEVRRIAWRDREINLDDEKSLYYRLPVVRFADGTEECPLTMVTTCVDRREGTFLRELTEVYQEDYNTD